MQRAVQQRLAEQMSRIFDSEALSMVLSFLHVNPVSTPHPCCLRSGLDRQPSKMSVHPILERSSWYVAHLYLPSAIKGSLPTSPVS